MTRINDELNHANAKIVNATNELEAAERKLLLSDLSPSGRELAQQTTDPKQKAILESYGDLPPGDRREDLQADADAKALRLARLQRRVRALISLAQERDA
ncbi:MAG: hypothetical protein MUF10_10760 [Thermoanaerobaculaceae bacterium]|nr:hypothetical protein [Thermoanaerobaculaceae bacterium]